LLSRKSPYINCKPSGERRGGYNFGKLTKTVTPIVKLDQASNESGKYFVDFSLDITLREVVLGMNCNSPIDEIRKLVNSKIAKIRVI
jgi:hypothetical protein